MSALILLELLFRKLLRPIVGVEFHVPQKPSHGVAFATLRQRPKLSIQRLSHLHLRWPSW
jgi:hypothetical protein